jgi:hypothetical protein
MQELTPGLRITVINHLGQVIETFHPTDTDISIGNNYAPGIYFAVISNGGYTRILKLVKG